MRARNTAASLGATLAVLLVAATAFAQTSRRLDDGQIKTLVERELADKKIENVSVDVSSSVVTLKGTVPSLWAKETAIDEAHQVPDVTDVVSELAITRGESDQAVGQAIADRLNRYVFYTIFDDVNILVNNGAVTLSGRVTMPYKADQMAQLASRITGVQELKNDIRTLPVSDFDNQLRVTIADRIYREPLFWNYAIQVNPPLHIIVENSRVSLVGVVNSEVERRMAETIARSTFGVLSVDNQLRIES